MFISLLQGVKENCVDLEKRNVRVYIVNAQVIQSAVCLGLLRLKV